MSDSSEEEEFKGEEEEESSSDDDEIPLAQLKTAGKASPSKRPRAAQRKAIKEESDEEEEEEEEDDEDHEEPDDDDEDDEEEDYEDEDEEPPSKKRKAKKDDSSSSDDDVPLSALKSPPKKKAASKNGVKKKSSNGTTKKAAPKKKAATANKKAPPKRKNSKSDESNQTLSAALYASDCDKGLLIQRLLCRWWYAITWPDPESLPAKPPKHYDSLDGFPGVYICTEGDDVGKIRDFRDKDNCPSFNNFVEKSSKELQSLLLKAIQEQRRQLVDADGEGTPTEKELKEIEKWAKKINCDKADRSAAKVLKAAGLKKK